MIIYYGNERIFLRNARQFLALYCGKSHQCIHCRADIITSCFDSIGV